MTTLALIPLVLALGAEPDSLVQRLGRLDRALYSGKADSVWEVASARATRNTRDRLSALQAGSSGGMLSRAESPAFLQQALGADSTLSDPISLQAAILIGSRAILDGNAPTAQLWLERATMAGGRLRDSRALAQALSLLAELDLRAGNPKGALARITLADATTSLADTLSRARLLCTRSRTSAFLGLHDSADRDARDGTTLARAAGLQTLAGTCLASLGVAQAQRATLFAADTTLTEAVALLQRAGAPRVLGSALQWHGYVLRELARLGEAEVELRAAASIGNELRDRTILGWSYLNLGLVASAFGDLERARDDLAHAVAAFDGHLDAWGHHTALLTLAHLQRQLGDSVDAAKNTQAALAWAQASGNAFMALLAWTQLAWQAETVGDIPGARAHLDSASATARRAGLVDAQHGARYQQARLDIASGRSGVAIPALKTYLADLPSVPARRYAARARLAEAYATTGDAAGASRELSEAMVELDSWRASLQEDALRRAVFGASVDDPDHDLGVATVIAAVAHAGDVATAFTLAERRRARALQDQLLVLQAARVDAGREERNPGAVLEPIPAVRAALGTDAALVTFVTGRGNEPTTAFVLTADTLFAVGLTPLDALRREIMRARTLLESQDSLPSSLRERLGATLVEPWAKELPTSIRLVILVPDDLLHRVPFVLLPFNERGERLGAQFALAQAPSASVLVHLRHSRDPALGGILAFGDPSLPADAPLPRSDTARRRLPGARAEVRAIARRVDGVTLFTGNGAREAELTSGPAEGARLIHFATHAEVDERSTVGSYVLLAPGDGADGVLTAAEVRGLRLSAEVVVLSACRTAGGRLMAGEGIQGITAPLLAAGAKSVVASQWDVDDRATARFMRDFYAALLDQPVAYALADAQRAARSRGEPPHVWAAFVVVGDPFASPNLTPASQPWTPLIGLLAFAGVATVLWMRRRNGAAATRSFRESRR
jgi:CHAT domain-containing protein/tetratricopeptide (TPR) repeat protein